MHGAALTNPSGARSLLRLRDPAGMPAVVAVFYGPPGTGKTLAAVRRAVELCDPTFTELDDPRRCFEHFNRELGEQVSFLTFHQALQYEDVVESIRPVLRAELSEPGEEVPDEDSAVEAVEESEAEPPAPAARLEYERHVGPLLRLIEHATLHEDLPHAVVIDEINRGDLGRILGPLISSIEPDKRVGADFPIGFESQYASSSEVETRIFMPANLHVLGTMNSSDRNIALVDHALRRRFDFVPVLPDAGLLSHTHGAPEIDLAQLLETLNRRIRFLLDEDHEIGHGFFMAVLERIASPGA